MHTFIITSAAYVDSELVAEFGRLPPAFLPLGTHRLFQHQHRALKSYAARIILSLPEGFALDDTDAAHLSALGIEPVFLPEGLKLGESVVYTINVTDCAHGAVSILHGDSLMAGIGYGELDAVSVTKTPPPPGYGWAWARRTAEGLRVFRSDKGGEAGDMALTGFFSFSEGNRLVQAITRCKGDFVAGLADYALAKPMMTLTSDYWFDFGHSSTYHRSRRRITTEREFNRLTAAGRSVVKSGTKPQKLQAEAQWFEGLPPALRVYTPAYLGRREEDASFSYSLEYMLLPSLADLAVFGRLEAESWSRVFTACDEALCALAAHAGPAVGAGDARGLYLDKTMERLEQLAGTRSVDPDADCRLGGRPLPSLRRMAESCAAMIPERPDSTLVHGDFCFSNVLYDMRADGVRMIDPRGTDAKGRISPFGDIRYDIAKLYHSAVGLYDHIIAGHYQLKRHSELDFELELPETQAIRTIRETFLRQEFAGMDVSAARALPIAILLFLSMPPLHADNPQRQMALLANGIRLFSLFDHPQGLAAE